MNKAEGKTIEEVREMLGRYSLYLAVVRVRSGHYEAHICPSEKAEDYKEHSVIGTGKTPLAAVLEALKLEPWTQDEIRRMRLRKLEEGKQRKRRWRW